MCPADTSTWCLIRLAGDAGKSWVAATVFGVNTGHVVETMCKDWVEGREESSRSSDSREA